MGSASLARTKSEWTGAIHDWLLMSSMCKSDLAKGSTHTSLCACVCVCVCVSHQADPKFEAEVEERLNKYYKKGYQLIARGQVRVFA